MSANVGHPIRASVDIVGLGRISRPLTHLQRWSYHTCCFVVILTFMYAYAYAPAICVSSTGAAPYDSFRRVTNPHMCELGGVLVLGSSGQNIDDMAKYTRGQDRWAWG